MTTHTESIDEESAPLLNQENNDEPISESINQPVNQSINQSNIRSVNRPFCYMLAIVSCSLIAWCFTGNQSINLLQSISLLTFSSASAFRSAISYLSLPQSINQSINHPVTESIDFINQSINQFPVNSPELAGHCWNASLVDPWNIQSINQSFDQSMIQAINQSVNLSVSQSIILEAAYMMYHDYRAVFPDIYSMINRLTGQPSDQLINQSIKPSNRQLVDQSINQSTNQSNTLLLRSRFYSLVRAVYERYEAAKRAGLDLKSINQSFDMKYPAVDEELKMTGTLPVFEQSINQPNVRHSKHISFTLLYQSQISQSTNQSVNQSINQSISQWTQVPLESNAKIEWDQSSPLMLYLITTELNPSVRQCSGGLPLTSHWTTSHHRRRPMIQDWFQGVYQIVIQHDLPSFVTGWSSLNVRYEYQTFLIHVNVIAPNNQSINQSSDQSINQSMSRSERCSLGHFSTIDDEWRGDWIKLAESGESSFMEPSPSLSLRNGSILNESMSDSLCDGRVCSGMFPSFDTYPFAWHMPWIYRRSSCHMHIYSVQESWKCVNNTWLFIVGDSTMQDYIRNLIAFPLGRRERFLSNVERESDEIIYSPDGLSRMRITMIWGGAEKIHNNFLGVFTFLDSIWRANLEKWWDGVTHVIPGMPNVPSTVMFISGLHDGRNSELLDGRGGFLNDQMPIVNISIVNNTHDTVSGSIWSSASDQYRDQVRYVLAQFHNMNKPHAVNNTRYIWRTTVAPAAEHSTPSATQANVYSIRAMNSVVVSEMKFYQQQHANDSAIQWLLDDQYDVSHAWNEEAQGKYSDGGHYGRPPIAGGPYKCAWCVDNPFVEIIQTHISLNMMCAT